MYGPERVNAKKPWKQSVLIYFRHVHGLKQEARRLKNIGNHPSIISLLGVIMEKDNYSLVLEYMLFGSSNMFVHDFQGT